jgi:Holliday junction DNA helicase RuvA
MIASLKGTVEEKFEEALVIDVNGVGYRVGMSLLSLGRAPRVGEPIRVRVQTVVREDALDLFGFLDADEEALFGLLTSVSHVGPRVAMGILSGIEPADLADAIRSGNVNRLKSIHGVGKKTAERLVVELKDKIATLAIARGSKGLQPSVVRPAGKSSDLISALVNLGYKAAQAESMAAAAEEKLGEEAELEGLLREALKAAR